MGYLVADDPKRGVFVGTTWCRVLKTDSGNFTPPTRTPWGGEAIARIKRSNGLLGDRLIPDHIGETWEVSVDPSQPSAVNCDGEQTTLRDFFRRASSDFVGAETTTRFGGQCPVLLKWIHADTPLSVQLHPAADNPRLHEGECGKHEAWLVLDVEPGSRIYLGFEPGYTVADITRLVVEGRVQECLYSFEPHRFDYIAIPPGVVHALGAGVLVIEPQSVEPGSVAVTWRLSDWGRRYDASGRLSAEGLPRDLHGEMALSAIDWSLPRGGDLIQRLLCSLRDDERWCGSPDNPFAATVFRGSGLRRYRPLVDSQFGVVTCWSGQVYIGTRQDPDDVADLIAGESAVIAANSGELDFDLCALGGDEAGVAVFSLRFFH